MNSSPIVHWRVSECLSKILGRKSGLGIENWKRSEKAVPHRTSLRQRWPVGSVALSQTDNGFSASFVKGIGDEPTKKSSIHLYNGTNVIR